MTTKLGKDYCGVKRFLEKSSFSTYLAYLNPNRLIATVFVMVGGSKF